MNKMFLSTLCAAIALCTGCSSEADAKKKAAVPDGLAKPALWVLKDSDTTIYLFGSVHVLKKDVNWLHSEVKTAFDSSQEAVFELVDDQDPKNMADVMKMAVDPDGPPLSQKLTEKDREAYTKAMAKMGLPVAGFEQFEPWFAFIGISGVQIMKMGYDPNNGVDKILTAEAKKAGKKLVGLETTLQQTGFFDTMTEKTQISMLNETVKGLDEGAKVIDTMVSSWTKGDTDKLAKLMNKDVDKTPDLEKILLTDRNARWAQWIDDRMDQPGTVFITVGAGHLAGKNSVQNMLKAHKLDAVAVKRQ